MDIQTSIKNKTIEEDDILYKCLLKYEELIYNIYTYTIEGGISFNLVFNKKNFVHLIGLHKLKDKETFKNLKPGTSEIIYRKIKQKKIKYCNICDSTFFYEIEDRLNYFLFIDKLLFTKVIINFNKNLINSSLKSNIILYTKIDPKYIHLCIHNQKNNTYPESFFTREDKYYITKQKKRLVKNIKILNKKTKKTEQFKINTNGTLEKYIKTPKAPAKAI